MSLPDNMDIPAVPFVPDYESMIDRALAEIAEMRGKIIVREESIKWWQMRMQKVADDDAPALTITRESMSEPILSDDFGRESESTLFDRLRQGMRIVHKDRGMVKIVDGPVEGGLEFWWCSDERGNRTPMKRVTINSKWREIE